MVYLFLKCSRCIAAVERELMYFTSSILRRRRAVLYELNRNSVTAQPTYMTYLHQENGRTAKSVLSDRFVSQA